MVWRHRRMLELFTEKPNLYRTRQPETDAAMIRQTETSMTIFPLPSVGEG